MNQNLNIFSGSVAELIIEKQAVYVHNETYKELFSEYRKRIIAAGLMVHFFQQFAGINMVLAYSYYFPIASGKYRYNLRFILGFSNCIFTALGLYLIKEYKRKPMFLIGYLILCACNSIIFLLFDKIDGIENDVYIDMAKGLTIIVIGVFMITYSLSVGTLTWVYATEILTDKGMSLAVGLHWTGNATIFFLPNIVISFSKHGSLENYAKFSTMFFLLYSGVGISAFFFCLLFFKETHLKSRKAIKKQFRDDFINSKKL